MKNKMLFIFLLICISLGACMYLQNDGFYMIEKSIESELQFINKNAQLELPKETIIKSCLIEKDIDSYFFSHNQYIKAHILVPTETINILFPSLTVPDGLRDYENVEFMLMDEKEKEIDFTVWYPIAVKKWYNKTQRTVLIHVMKNTLNNYTEIYLYTDKLGWNICNN